MFYTLKFKLIKLEKLSKLKSGKTLDWVQVGESQVLEGIRSETEK